MAISRKPFGIIQEFGSLIYVDLNLDDFEEK